PLLSVEDLRVEFVTDRGWTTVVSGVSFSVGEGETVALVGESGSGKTVTGLSIMGLLPPKSARIAGGRILFEGRDLTRLREPALRRLRGDRVSMIFQEPMTSLNPAYTVGEQISEVVRKHRGASRRAALARATEMLDLVGIPNASRRVHEYPHEFSGGMRQRVMIAMALACDPRLIIADEPTTALDVTIQAQVLDLMRRLGDELGTAMLFVTHDLGVVAEIADRVVVMYAGEVVETAPVDPVYVRPRHPYTAGLLESLPQVGAEHARLSIIPGRPPEPWAMPRGCRFAPRCRFAVDACTSGHPDLYPVGEESASRCIRIDELDLRSVE
ncbi:MAG: ABC transporter ATP-binding protein, partial [Microbacteriaceae bacterium]|nr:ABC transporter ATP-binding protein [Microbacteriaceae bacterium]